MKKSLIALAALATVATAAQAQSSVTIYGVIDAGVASVTNVGSTAASAKTNTGMVNGGLSTPRIGFKGTEDLGGGLKANFALEAEFLADTGAQTSTAEALFARESSVGLSGNFGEVKLGRINTFGYGLLAKFDALGGNNVGGAVATGQRQARIENAVQYMSPVFNGVQLGLQSGTRTSSTTNTYGEIAGDTSANRINSLALTYDQGPLELAYIYSTQNDYNGDKMLDFNTAFARYNFGVARVVLGYSKQNIDRKAASGNTTAGYYTTASTNTSTAVSGSDQTSSEKLFLGANVPVTANVTINAQVEQIEYKYFDGVKKKPTIYTLGANYAFSKRTTAYAIYSKVDQDNGSTQDMVDTGKWSGFAGGSTKDRSAAVVGIRHTF